MMKQPELHQLFEEESYTYTYVLSDPETKEAIVIDSVATTVDRDYQLISRSGLKVKYILETHLHADHITGSGTLRSKTGGKIGISKECQVGCADINLSDNQVLSFGQFELKAIHTPGHTNGCITYFVGGMLFTGDTLLIGGCGRTDFQEGSSQKLFQSVRTKLFQYPDDTMIYPAHDYKGSVSTTVGTEKKSNTRLNLAISESEFIEIMANLNLPSPKKIEEALPANKLCGL